jgi:hypothetical protein
MKTWNANLDESSPIREVGSHVSQCRDSASLRKGLEVGKCQ